MRLVLIFRPWGRSKLSRAVAAYLDGVTETVVGYPAITAMFEEAHKKWYFPDSSEDPQD